MALLKRAPGAGRPGGSGKFGEKTKVVRLPESLADNALGLVEKYQDLERIINQYHDELEPRKDSPRAKEAYKMISELLYILKS